jgi:hypothetical protein
MRFQRAVLQLCRNHQLQYAAYHAAKWQGITPKQDLTWKSDLLSCRMEKSSERLIYCSVFCQHSDDGFRTLPLPPASLVSISPAEHYVLLIFAVTF